MASYGTFQRVHQTPSDCLQPLHSARRRSRLTTPPPTIPTPWSSCNATENSQPRPSLSSPPCILILVYLKWSTIFLPFIPLPTFYYRSVHVIPLSPSFEAYISYHNRTAKMFLLPIPFGEGVAWCHETTYNLTVCLPSIHYQIHKFVPLIFRVQP